MRLTFLGTGTSHGVPVIGCDCAVCRSPDPRNRRLRTSVLMESAATTLLVDAPPDFRQQALRAGLRGVDAVLLTHTHADHVFGLDDLRVFSGSDRRLPIFGSPESIADVARIFPYACAEQPRWPGVPRFALQPVKPFQQFEMGDLKVQSLPVRHGFMTVFGFVFNRQIAYLTDCNAVPPETIAAIRGVPVLVLDALRPRPHPTHLTIAEALEVARQVNAKLTLFTHMTHEVDHGPAEAALPARVRLAFDGMRVEVTNGELVVAGHPFESADRL
jgi:phosphoribosyl 1,2-cyclic phosphate phosphodiesterase